jgi:hypothetical protein
MMQSDVIAAAGEQIADDVVIRLEELGDLDVNDLVGELEGPLTRLQVLATLWQLVAQQEYARDALRGRPGQTRLATLPPSDLSGGSVGAGAGREATDGVERPATGS